MWACASLLVISLAQPLDLSLISNLPAPELVLIILLFHPITHHFDSDFALKNLPRRTNCALSWFPSHPDILFHESQSPSCLPPFFTINQPIFSVFSPPKLINPVFWGKGKINTKSIREENPNPESEEMMSVCGKHKYSKSVLGLVFCALLTVTYLFLIGTVDVGSHIVPFFQFEPLDPNPSWVVPTCRSLTPLRVYMYDLPRRFNVGMLNRRSSDKTPVTAATLPPWPTSSGLRKQHSVEYWMMASLLYDGGGEERESEMEAVRVLDPDVADVFFVPFFSSLSFNTYGHNMTDPETERDKKLQADTLKFLRGSKYWQKSGGRDHVIPMHHPNAFRFFRDQVNASILIVADFGRYPKSLSNLRKDVVAPYVHVVDSYTEDESSDPFESRPTLLFFRGRTVRKDEGVIRAKLANVLAEYNDVHYETSFASEENIRLSTQGMRSSKFCLHPAGDTPSSCRLFDAIVSHCVPVIVSDQIELPFEDELDYSQFAIFFSTKEALKPGYMVKQLRKIPKERWVSMWKRLKNISHKFEFQHPPKSADAVNMIWRQVRHKLPAAKLADHRTRRLKIPDWWGDRR